MGNALEEVHMNTEPNKKTCRLRSKNSGKRLKIINSLKISCSRRNVPEVTNSELLSLVS